MTKHSTPPDPERPLKLSQEVSRIGTKLARLSGLGGGGAPQPSAETVTAAIQARRQRSQFLPPYLFGEPAWDMLLELFHAELTNRGITAAGLCDSVAVPVAVGERWIDALVQEGLVVRRSTSLELSPEGSEALRHYFADMA